MKRIFGIALVLAVVATLAFGSVTLADDPPTEVNMSWSGVGSVGTTVTAGNDALIQFGTSGTSISGTFTAKDFNNNPYGYNVDTVSSYITSAVSEGITWYQVNRTDSKTSMYGPAGQVAYSFIATSGGTAQMATGGQTNYAGMVNCTYGQPKTTSGKNFEANAASYSIWSFIAEAGLPGTPTDNWAEFFASGSGTALIDCMTTEASGGYKSLRLGWGGGCYTNADAVFTGSGTFGVNAVGSNQIRTPIADQYGNLVPGAWVIPGNGSYGSCSYNVIANFVGNFSVGNFSVDVQ